MTHFFISVVSLLFFSRKDTTNAKTTETESSHWPIHQSSRKNQIYPKKLDSRYMDIRSPWTRSLHSKIKKSNPGTPRSELIPTVIHAYFGHLGGVGEVK